MKIKRGYKQTEIGIIPEDWDCVQLSDEYVSIHNGGTPRTSNPSFWDGGIPWCTPTDITKCDGNFIFSTDRTISPLGLQNSSGILLPVGTILLCSRATVGDAKLAGVQITTNQGFKNIVVNEKKLSNRFLYYFLQTQKDKMLEKSSGSTFLELNKKEVSRLHIPFPPLPEQSAIAHALGDADALISSLEKLITKKRQIKQGAMQELLTGRRRLEGFDGAWEVVNFADKSILKARIGWQGLTTAEYRNDGFSYLVTGTDFLNGRIDWNGCHYVDKSRFDQDPYIQLRNGDVLITKDGTIGKVALIERLTKNATLNSGVFVIRPIGEAYSNTFFYFVLSSEIFDDFLTRLSAGSTINHLYQKDFVAFRFCAPPTIEEQIAIAKILTEMDDDIAATEHALEKYRKIKQGMMQELLTGRTRLM